MRSQLDLPLPINATRLLQSLAWPLDRALERAVAPPLVKSAAEEALRLYSPRPLPLLTREEAALALRRARLNVRARETLEAIAAANGITVAAALRAV